MGLLNLFDPARASAAVSTPPVSPTCARAPSRRWAPNTSPARTRVLGHIGARGTAYWNVRLLDHLFELRRDPRPFPAAGKPRAFAERLARDLGKPVTPPTTGSRRARRRHRRRGVAARATRAAARDRVDQARRVRRSLRHDERRRALADRHHGQDGRRRLGTVQAGRSGACARTSRRASFRRDVACGAGRDRRRTQARPRARRRDDPAVAPRPVLSDIALGHAMLEKARAWASGSGCATPEARARRK